MRELKEQVVKEKDACLRHRLAPKIIIYERKIIKEAKEKRR